MSAPGELVVEAALVALSARERRAIPELVEALRTDDRRLHAEFRVALAWAVQHYLKRLDPDSYAIYLVGSSLDDEARRSSDVDIVLATTNATPALRQRFEPLNADVSRAYRALLGGVPPNFRLLDLKIVAADPRSLAAWSGSSRPRHRLA